MERGFVDEDGDELGASLSRACKKGHLEVATVLLAAGAKPDRARGYDGYTALHLASNCGHLKVVKALVAAGADTSVKVSFCECASMPG